MKKLIAIILTVMIYHLAIGQNLPVSYVNYPDNNKSDKNQLKIDYGINEITLKENNQFEFWSRPHVSCFTWQEHNGKWEKKNDSIIFTEKYEIVESDAKLDFKSKLDNEEYILNFRTDKNSKLDNLEIEIQLVYDYDSKLDDVDFSARLNSSGAISIPFSRIENRDKLASIRYSLILPNNEKRFGYLTETGTVNIKEKELSNFIKITLLESPQKETVVRTTKGIINGNKLIIVSQSKTNSKLQDYTGDLVFKDDYKELNRE